MGTLTAQVIRKVKWPVLTVPKEARYQPFKKMVFATDYEKFDSSIEQFLSFAKSFDAEAIILHDNIDEGYFEPAHFENYKKTAERLAGYEKLHFEFFSSADVLKCVNDYIREHDIDLLAMLTHKKHLLDKFFEKSYTCQMVMHTKVPLLAFHE